MNNKKLISLTISWILVVIPGLAVLSFADNKSETNIEAQQHFEKANELHKLADYNAAIAEYNKVLNLSTDDKIARNAQYWIGQSYFGAGQFDEALAAFQKLLDEYPDSTIIPSTKQMIERVQKAKKTKSLFEAIKKGDVDQVKLLISKGADINEKDKKGWTPLHSAAWYSHKNIAELLIAEGANIDETDVSGQTPLYPAVRSSESNYVAELLIAKGSNAKAKDKVGNTPLHHAVGYWDVNKDVLKLLITKGADVNARNDEGQTPLHLTALSRKPAYRGDFNSIFLIDNGADVNAKDKHGVTPLYVAVGNGRRDIVELLLAKGATINEKTDEDLTAIHRASMMGHTEIAELLLRRMGRGNSVLYSKDKHGCTPLHYASMAGCNDIVELLISNDVHVNAEDARGATPAQLAAARNHNDTVNLLISKGADVSTIQLAAYVGDLTKVKSFIEKGVSVNAQDGYGLTPLHAAAGTGQREVVEFLITGDASVNAGAVEEGLGMPLHYANDGGSKDVAELLISKGAAIDARNKDGVTPLHVAAQKGHSELAKLLIANKADVNAKTTNDWIPLHLAAVSGHAEIVALLIENGSDMNGMTEPRKWTPLFYAARAGHKGVMKVLLDKGADVSPVGGVDGLLYWVCVHGDRDLAEILIQKGANVNSEAEGWGAAPSLYAVWNDQPDILKLLLDHSANPDAKDRHGWSLLHYTIDSLCRSLDMTRMLLEKGANPNAKISADGSTPFGWAVGYDLTETVELLIAHGADVNAKDSNGHTRLQYAKRKGYTEMVELLRKHGAKE
ncbi:ankyrin repeat domain-containing protein [Planctomycetota bacterium]